MEQLLESREKRAAFQKILLEGYGLPLVSFTVNMPGAVKKSPRSAAVFQAGQTALREALAGYVVYFKLLDRETGPEGYFLVELPAGEIKRITCGIEETHPLGRLMDLDVLEAPGRAISRQALSLPARRCLVCGRAAVLCARSGAHSLTELYRVIDGMLAAWEELGHDAGTHC